MAGERISSGKKQVVILQKKGGGMFCQGDIDPADHLGSILEIAKCLEDGVPVPEKFYRRSLGRDYLFEEKGWLHLHIDVDGSDDVLLFVKVVDGGVIFLGLTRHDIFDEKPRGKSLAGLGSKIAAAEMSLKSRSRSKT